MFKIWLLKYEGNGDVECKYLINFLMCNFIINHVYIIQQIWNGKAMDKGES